MRDDKVIARAIEIYKSHGGKDGDFELLPNDVQSDYCRKAERELKTTKSTSQRDDLILRMMSGIYGFSHKDSALIADFILADRKRVVEPLVIWKKDYDNGGNMGSGNVILETLKLAGVEQ